MNKQPRKRFERGQSLIEFAFSAMILATLFSGLIDLARVYFTYIALEDAAGEAALFLSINPTCIDAFDCPDPNNAHWRAENAVQGQLATMAGWDNPAPEDQPRINADLPSVNAVGGTVFVTITYDHTLITPLIRNLVAGGDAQIELQVEARQTIVSE
jgi:Flp pilus assembly protein TadG